MSDFLNIMRMAAPIVGTIAGGPVGGAIGTGVAGILGAMSAGKLEKDYKKAEAAVPMYDAGQLSFLGDVRNKRRMYEAGMDKTTGSMLREVGQSQAQTQANITRAAGGNLASTMDSLLRSQAVTGAALPQIGANAQRQALGLLGMEGQIVDDMAQRAYKLKTRARDFAMARWATAQQGAESNMMAAIGMIPQLGFRKDPIGGPPVTGVPSSAQIGSPDSVSGYVDTGLGAEVTGLGSPGTASHWM